MIKKPLISVIIPVFNDPEGLRDTLISITSQDFDKSAYEIIIIDNVSKDNTLDIANEYKSKYPGLIKIYIEDKVQSSYAARNKGIEYSNSEVLAFIDSDMSVCPDWLARIKSLMFDKEIKYAGCNVKIVLKNKSLVGLYNKILGFKVKNRINNDHYAPTCCLVINKEILSKTGMFDSRFISGGDMEFGNRVWRTGYKQSFAGEILLEHPARDNLKKLLKKYFRTGRGKFQLFHYYPVLFGYEGNIFLHHLYINPWSYVRDTRKKLKAENSPAYYSMIFYFIKCLHRCATLIGYYYEKRKINKKIYKS